MANKRKAGLWGAAAVIAILALQSIERWTVVESVLAGLRGAGAGGSFVANILISPLLPLALAIAAVYLAMEGSKEKKDSFPARERIPATVENRSESNPTQTLNASPQITQQVILTPSAEPEEPKEKEEVPVVSYIQAKPAFIEQDEYGIWHEVLNPGAQRGIVAQFKNVSRNVGQKTPKASSVTASLVFRSPENLDEQELHINHGTWLGRYEHSVTFYSGDTHHLLIAAKLLPFVTFENPNSFNLFSGRWRHGMSVRRPRPVEVPRTEGHLEITLVDSWGVTVFSGLFDYILLAETMSLTPHPVP